MFLISGFCLFGPRLFAADSSDKGTVVVVCTSAADELSNSSFGEVINNAIVVELKIAGYNPVTTAHSTDILGRIYSTGGPFLIENTYKIDGPEIMIRSTCYRTDLKTIVYSVSETGKLDLELDDTIRKTVRNILPRISESLREQPFRPPLTADGGGHTSGSKKDEDPAVAESVGSNGTEAGVNLAGTNDSGAPVGQSAAVPEKSVYTPSQTAGLVTADRKKHLTFSLGFSPFLTTGEASGYFTFGYVPEIFTGLLFPLSHGYFGFGLSGSANYFQAEGILLTSDNLLISAAPEIRLVIQADSLLGLLLRINGGASLFMMNRNGEGYQSAVIPYASGGMGIMMNFSQGMGIQFLANYTAYIESSVLITGFSPSVGVFFLL